MRILIRAIRTARFQEYPFIIINTHSTQKPTSYIINVPEGIDRTLHQYKLNIFPGSRIFFTKFDAAHNSGLLALLFTLIDRISIYGVRLYGNLHFARFFDNMYSIFGLKLFCFSHASMLPGEYSESLSVKPGNNIVKDLIENRQKIKNLYDIKLYLSKRYTAKQIDSAEKFIKKKFNQQNKEEYRYYEDQDCLIYPVTVNQGEHNQTINYIIKTKPQVTYNKELVESTFNEYNRKKLFKEGKVVVKGKQHNLKDYEKIDPYTAKFFIIECDDVNQAKLLLKAFQDHPEGKNPEAIFHLTLKNVILSREYNEFMNYYSQIKCQQVILSQGFYQKMTDSDNASFSQNIQKQTNTNYNQIQSKKVDQHVQSSQSLTSNEKYQLSNKTYLHIIISKLLNKLFPSNFPKVNENEFKPFAICDDRIQQTIIPENNKILQHSPVDDKVLSIEDLKIPQCKIWSNDKCFVFSQNEKGFQEIPGTLSGMMLQSSINSDYLGQQFRSKVQQINKKQATLAKNKINDNSSIKAMPEIQVLGSSSSKPTGHRNVSSILIRPNMNNEKLILLDCGHSTILQLLATAKDQEAFKQIIRNINIIYISHYHVDHHLGLMGVLHYRKKYFLEESKNNPIFIVMPRNLLSWNQQYINHIEQFPCVFILHDEINNSKAESNIDLKYSLSQPRTIRPKKKDLADDDNDELIDVLETDKMNNNENSGQRGGEQQNQINNKSETNKFMACLQQMGVKQFRPVNVKHCPSSTGLVLETIEGFKIVYSGDTRPDANLIRFGQNASLLIHECTFTDQMKGEAKEKMHSTLEEAVKVAQQMKAERLLLTHFSMNNTLQIIKSRIHKETFNYVSGDRRIDEFINQKTAFASDFLKFNLSQFEYLPELSRLAIWIY